MKRFRFSREITGKVTHLIEEHTIAYDSGWSDGEVRRLIRRVGSRNMDHLISLRKADILAHGRKNQKLDLLYELEKRMAVLCKRPLLLKMDDLAIDGNRVMAILGMNPGPDVGKVLDQLMERITDHPELNNEMTLTSILEEMKRSEH